jgi:hypothetical protein
MEKLAAVLGHSSTEVTKRYAHLRPDLFRPEDHELLAVDLERGDAAVVSIAPEISQPEASGARHSKRRRSEMTRQSQ